MSITPIPTAATPAPGPTEPAWHSIFPHDFEQRRAGEVWSEVVGEMEVAGTLSRVVGLMIQRYCVAAVLFERAAAEVGTHGAVRARKGGQLPAWNLNFSAMRDSASMMESLEAELGLSPRRRAGVTAAKSRRRQAGKADAYLGAAAR